MRQPYIARSTAYTWSSGSPISPDLSFLASGPPMASPEIQNLRIRVQLNLTTGGGGGVAGRAMCQAVQQVQLTDPRGVRVNCLGSSIRQIMQREFGAGAGDPADLAAGQAGASRTVELVIPFSPRRMRTAEDYRPSVTDFVNGAGKLDINMATATQINANTTINSATVEVWAEIVDGGGPKSKPRLTYYDYGQTTTDFPFPVRGLLLDAWMRARDADIDSATTLSTQNITSAQLYYSNYASELLNDIYRKQPPSLATNDDVVAGYAHNIFVSHDNLKLSQLPFLDVLQVRIDGSLPTSSRIVMAVITKRSEEAMARQLGFDSFGEAAGHLGQLQVDGDDGTRSLASTGAMGAFLPVSLPAGPKKVVTRR